MRKIILSAMFLFACTFAGAQTAITELPYQTGEEARFVVSFRAKMWPNTDMGKVTIKVTDDVVHNTDTYCVSAYVRTTAFRWIFKMDNYYTSWIDKKSHLPVKASCEISEGNYEYNNDYHFRWDANEVDMRWSKPGRYEDKTRTLPITDDARDIISLIYSLRASDIGALGVGKEHYIELLNQDTIRHLAYSFKGVEKKEIKDIGKINTLHFVCQVTTRDGEKFEDGNDLHVWFSDDRNRIPG